MAKKGREKLKLKVLKFTPSGNYVLSGASRGLEGKVPFFYARKRAGYVFDTIGRVDLPLYLGKPEGKEPEKLVGKIVEIDAPL